MNVPQIISLLISLAAIALASRALYINYQIRRRWELDARREHEKHSAHQFDKIITEAIQRGEPISYFKHDS